MGEYELLQRRKFRDYSVGHRRMYQGPCTLLAGANARVLDVGAGIGYGLALLREHGVFREYVGLEPNPRAYAYTLERSTGWEGVKLHNASFPCPDVEGVFDHVFCIEVVEHLPPDGRGAFLEGLRRVTGKILWLSTPDSRKSSHGALSTPEWEKMLEGVGFRVVVVEEQWTTLFVCRPV